jgi:integrase/recombinase XerD
MPQAAADPWAIACSNSSRLAGSSISASFCDRRFGPFTTRRIQQIVQGYREMAGITQPLHPHLFRHQMLTYLTSKGLTDAQIQLISGHESKKSLEVYQHLSLESVDKAYQDAVQSVGI